MTLIPWLRTHSDNVVSPGELLEKNLNIAIDSRDEKKKEFEEFVDGFDTKVLEKWDKEIAEWHTAQRAVHLSMNDAKSKLKEARKVDNPYEEVEPGNI